MFIRVNHVNAMENHQIVGGDRGTCAPPQFGDFSPGCLLLKPKFDHTECDKKSNSNTCIHRL